MESFYETNLVESSNLVIIGICCHNVGGGSGGGRGASCCGAICCGVAAHLACPAVVPAAVLCQPILLASQSRKWIDFAGCHKLGRAMYIFYWVDGF